MIVIAEPQAAPPCHAPYSDQSFDRLLLTLAAADLGRDAETLDQLATAASLAKLARPAPLRAPPAIPSTLVSSAPPRLPLAPWPLQARLQRCRDAAAADFGADAAARGMRAAARALAHRQQRLSPLLAPPSAPPAASGPPRRRRASSTTAAEPLRRAFAWRRRPAPLSGKRLVFTLASGDGSGRRAALKAMEALGPDAAAETLGAPIAALVDSAVAEATTGRGDALIRAMLRGALAHRSAQSAALLLARAPDQIRRVRDLLSMDWSDWREGREILLPALRPETLAALRGADETGLFDGDPAYAKAITADLGGLSDWTRVCAAPFGTWPEPTHPTAARLAQLLREIT